MFKVYWGDPQQLAAVVFLPKANYLSKRQWGVTVL